ncbi:MAG: hypothetical protein EOO86_19190, partial [Pedobacter sp.]
MGFKETNLGLNISSAKIYVKLHSKIMRYFFHIAYQGQYFSGWQKQPGVKSVQEVIEQTLSKILKSPIT